MPLVQTVRSLRPAGAAQVDWSNPVSRGLLLALDPVNGFDAVTGEILRGLGGTGVSRAYSSAGQGIATNGAQTSAGLYFPDSPRFAGLSAMSVAVGFIGSPASANLAAQWQGAINSWICQTTAANGIMFGVLGSGNGAMIKQGGSIAAGVLSNFVATADASNVVIYQNGVPQTVANVWVQNTFTTTQDSTSPVCLLSDEVGERFSGSLYWLYIWGRRLSAAEAAWVAANPLGLLFRPQRPIFIALSDTQAPTGVSASVAATLDALTASSAATLRLAGSASNTLGALTSTSTATLRLAATLAGTLDALTLASSGTLGAAVTGSLTSTLGELTAASNGAVRLAGSLTATLGTLTGSAAGQLPISGQASQTLGALTAAGQGTLLIAGQAAQTLGALTLSATGALVAPGTGSVIATLGALTSSSAATLRLAGSAAVTLDALTSASTATLKIAATSASALGALTVSAAGTAQSAITGQLGATLGALSLSSSATVAFWSAASYQAGRVVLVPVHFGALIAPAHDGSVIVVAGDGVAVH